VFVVGTTSAEFIHKSHSTIGRQLYLIHIKVNAHKILTFVSQLRVVSMFVICTDTTEITALYVLPTLLAAPMVRCVDTTDRKRKRPWKPTMVEMMQACIMVIPV
jgi:hypothetical protein